jgi:hypothetical protein
MPRINAQSEMASRTAPTGPHTALSSLQVQVDGHSAVVNRLNLRFLSFDLIYHPDHY